MKYRIKTYIKHNDKKFYKVQYKYKYIPLWFTVKWLVAMDCYSNEFITKQGALDHIKHDQEFRNRKKSYCIDVEEVELNKDASYYVSVKDADGISNHHNVDERVYIYIRQLEAYIKNPKESGLKNAYPGRFDKKKTLDK